MSRGIRNSHWNYGGRNWKLSRSKIDLFIECPRCFYLDNKLGIRRPSMPSFLINSAVDALLKKEFDTHRKSQTPHPLFAEFGIDAIPYQHDKIDTWRENFEGVIVRHHDTHLTVSGAIDDLWQMSDGTIAVVDYKSTAKDALDMSSKWIQNYYRQLEVYQWLLQQSDVNVSPIGFILYANGDLSANSFSGQVKFRMSLHEHEGDTKWVEPLLHEIKGTLELNVVPEAGPECEHCEYLSMQSKLEGPNHINQPQKTPIVKAEPAVSKNVSKTTLTSKDSDSESVKTQKLFE